MEQRLAARDRYHRSAALVDRPEAFGDREPLVQDLVGVVNLPASRAGEIAAKQRLEHEDERVALASRQGLSDHIGADDHFLSERNSQVGAPSPYERGLRNLVRPSRRGDQTRASSAGRRNSIVSSRPARVETSTGPSRRKAAITSSTSTSGAEAPAV